MGGGYAVVDRVLGSPAEEREYELAHQWSTTKNECTQLYVASRHPKEDVARARRYRMTGAEPCGFARDEGFADGSSRWHRAGRRFLQLDNLPVRDGRLSRGEVKYRPAFDEPLVNGDQLTMRILDASASTTIVERSGTVTS